MEKKNAVYTIMEEQSPEEARREHILLIARNFAAGAAAVKAIGLLAKDKLMTNPCTAKSDELLCNGCSQCANVCPYGAISYETKLINDHGIREDRRVAVVNSALCQGCGACTVTCPSGAMDLQGFANRQILAEVDAICR